jgi:hypothetical protein
MHVFTKDAESGTLAPPMWRIALAARAEQGVLRTADKGAELHDEVIRGLRDRDPGVPVALDFAEVRAVTVPFVHESIGRLLGGWLSGYHDEHPLLVLNADDDVRETISAALRNQRLILLANGPGGPQLLGGDAVLEGTVQAAREFEGDFSVADLAEKLDLSGPATNNRLRTLARSGAVARRLVVPPGGGKEFVYRLPHVDD